MIVHGVILMKILNLNNILNLYKGVVGTPQPTRLEAVRAGMIIMVFLIIICVK
jgi:hypothetical protein